MASLPLLDPLPRPDRQLHLARRRSRRDHLPRRGGALGVLVHAPSDNHAAGHRDRPGVHPVQVGRPGHLDRHGGNDERVLRLLLLWLVTREQSICRTSKIFFSVTGGVQVLIAIINYAMDNEIVAARRTTGAVGGIMPMFLGFQAMLYQCLHRALRWYCFVGMMWIVGEPQHSEAAAQGEGRGSGGVADGHLDHPQYPAHGGRRPRRQRDGAQQRLSSIVPPWSAVLVRDATSRSPATTPACCPTRQRLRLGRPLRERFELRGGADVYRRDRHRHRHRPVLAVPDLL